MRGIVVLVLGLLLGGGVGRAGPALVGPAQPSAADDAQTPTFPHPRHEGLFPDCLSCHRGIPGGDTASYYPSRDVCGRCHDGSVEPKVSWTAPARFESNLHFTHPQHAAAAGPRGPAECIACHREPGRQGRMDVGPPVQADCAVCHTAARGHVNARVDCGTCHEPLSRATRLTIPAIARLPKPASHDSSDFLLSHRLDAVSGAATCATCHARESCERCHMNGASVPAIASLGRDARVALLAQGRPAEYPRPPSHTGAWRSVHGPAAAAATAACADCHARQSCQTCHRDVKLQEIERLPDVPEPGTRSSGAVGHAVGANAQASPPPQGVVVPVRSVHPAGWVGSHGTDAAAGTRCESCHEQSFCSSCHAASTRPSFHDSDVLERHGLDTWSSDTQCTACHSTETFCRSCHQQRSVAARGAQGAAFHGAQPMWLLQHGQAARQGLEGCVACHAQTDCARCHSAVGGWGVNPHGADFDAAAERKRNAITCQRCHPAGSIPGGGGGPEP